VTLLHCCRVRLLDNDFSDLLMLQPAHNRQLWHVAVGCMGTLLPSSKQSAVVHVSFLVLVDDT
jgi:hypothetical protein